jgi:hypothetical protein
LHREWLAHPEKGRHTLITTIFNASVAGLIAFAEMSAGRGLTAATLWVPTGKPPRQGVQDRNGLGTRRPHT